MSIILNPVLAFNPLLWALIFGVGCLWLWLKHKERKRKERNRKGGGGKHED